MKEYNLEVLKDAANRLLFDMSDEEYQTLLNEFDIIIKQMNVPSAWIAPVFLICLEDAHSSFTSSSLKFFPPTPLG